ncbi:hypothetical protein [Amycolatopsis sp. WQ 127309]|uniref:hypothetical protein n=1 Tax=Amycolatopsis sp. WQ 127309 TaxID=2932773 RepID=UPI001FF3F787|nr:hypothetical protein [Amycolatopsis sp. WQ 127309]UOZ05663.1 hypothetical protein MUY22_43695 [Amycolatopsis sp. WQ 127309]
MLVDRRDELGRARTQTVNRLHRLLLELFPSGAKKFLSATQARALVATVRPRDIVGKTRRRLAVELITELETIDRKIKAADKDLRELVIARGSTLLDLHGVVGCILFDSKKAAGKTSMEAMRALKRRLSNVVYARMLADRRPAYPPSESPLDIKGSHGSALGAIA